MRDRRLGYRIPLDRMLTLFVNDRPLRALVLDVSDTGLRIDVVAGRAPAAGTTVQLELPIPDGGEPIWASATVRYQRPDDLASGLGVRLVALATCDARRLRDFCIQARHRKLGALLARVTRAVPGMRATPA